MKFKLDIFTYLYQAIIRNKSLYEFEEGSNPYV